MELTQDQRRVKDFLDAHPHLSRGVGNEDEMCTIAAVSMALTGIVSDDPHPCVSPVIRGWVMTIQDAMGGAIRDSDEWRESIPLIAGSAASEEIEQSRVDRIMAWMWDALGDEAVLAAVFEDARPAWDRMLVERTADAARAAANAVAYAGTYAAVDAAYAVRAGAVAARADYWFRRDPAGLLAELVALR